MSSAEPVSELARITSDGSTISLLPCTSSNEEPAGTGPFFIRNTESPTEEEMYTFAFALLPVLFETKTLRITRVAVPPTVSILVVALDVTSAVKRLDFVSFLKVFAI